MEEDYIKLIFGLKVKQIRTSKELSLFKLGKLSGLSKSYLNEIEKGKKYPKTDKILAIAEALDVTYEELVSLKLDKNLAPVAEIFRSNLLQEIPLEIFGIEEKNLIEIISNAPSKVNAFISTLIEIGNNYNLTKESFYLASLRSFQEANDNYFPEIEKAAKDFMKSYGTKEEITETWMEEILQEEYGYTIIYEDFSKFKKGEMNILRSIFNPENNSLYINSSTKKDQKKFILAKEIGYNYLQLKERLYTYSIAKFDHFDALLNNFYASYFSGALLLPEEEMIKDIARIFESEEHNLELFNDAFKGYTESPETIFQRLTNILPKHFNIKDLFFLRLQKKTSSNSIRLTKELHLNQHQSPHANETYEHYCRRWVSTRVLYDFEESKTENHVLDAQMSTYPYHNDQKYYVISSASKDPFNPLYIRSVTIGILISRASQKIKFLNDENIKTRQVAVTCENCGMEDCKERAAEAIRFEKNIRYNELNKVVEEYISSKK